MTRFHIEDHQEQGIECSERAGETPRGFLPISPSEAVEIVAFYHRRALDHAFNLIALEASI